MPDKAYLGGPPLSICLEKVSVIGAHISLLRLLIFRQPKIRPCPIPISILHKKADEISNAAGTAQADERNAN